MALMQNNKTYDFEVYASSVLGTGFKKVVCLGCVPYETAILLHGEVAPTHAAVYSTGTLPVGTPDDPRQYDYYRVRLPDGSTKILGEVWIDASTVHLVESSHAVITLPDVTTTDVIRLREMLKQAGFVNFKIAFDETVQN